MTKLGCLSLVEKLFRRFMLASAGQRSESLMYRSRGIRITCSQGKRSLKLALEKETSGRAIER